MKLLQAAGLPAGGAAARMVNAPVAFVDPSIAVMVAVPAPTMAMSPAADAVATAGFDETNLK